ncbi:hypothetical protein Tco_1352587 [Tanacetum coccineum]
MSPTSSWSRSQPPKDEVNMSIGPLPDLYKWIVISGTFVVTRFVVGDDDCFCEMSGWVSSASVISTMSKRDKAESALIWQFGLVTLFDRITLSLRVDVEERR